MCARIGPGRVRADSAVPGLRENVTGQRCVERKGRLVGAKLATAIAVCVFLHSDDGSIGHGTTAPKLCPPQEVSNTCVRTPGDLQRGQDALNHGRPARPML